MSEMDWTSTRHSQLWAFVNNIFFITAIFLLLPMALQPGHGFSCCLPTITTLACNCIPVFGIEK